MSDFEFYFFQKYSLCGRVLNCTNFHIQKALSDQILHREIYKGESPGDSPHQNNPGWISRVKLITRFTTIYSNMILCWSEKLSKYRARKNTLKLNILYNFDFLKTFM